MDEKEIKKNVRQGYTSVAKKNISCCCSGNRAEEISSRIGYQSQELGAVPEGANLGLGCGNPTLSANLKPGEVVMDLGCGPGLDCFLAANKVGDTGKVIGVDMTPEMIDKARENAAKGKYKNVEFRLGEIENLPATDNSVDIIISNCVINLSTDKLRVFREAFRVLKPGGRITISDLVLLRGLPETLRSNLPAYIACVAGASLKEEYLGMIKETGFRDIKVLEETFFPAELFIGDNINGACLNRSGISVSEAKELDKSLVSIKVYAVKPRSS